MSRIRQVAHAITTFPQAESLLDVGCRDGILKRHIRNDIQYFGADLFPEGDHVNYVGDFTTMDFDRQFDIVTAVDVLEHLDRPSPAFDKLAGLAKNGLIVSLPNCYDLKKRYAFFFKGTLGGKYTFDDEDRLDRHRWVMGKPEIEGFYRAKAKRHGLSVTIHPVQYGASGSSSATSAIGRGLTALLPSTLATESVVGVFRR